MGTTIKEDVDLNNIYEEVIKYFWCDKGTSHSYIPIYEKLFSEYRNKHIKLVEVGIFDGGSLYLWNQYFTNATIIVVDSRKWTNYDKNKFDQMLRDNRNISYINADATSNNLADNFDSIDIFIDDASHKLKDQQKTFSIMWNKISNDGLYIIEDVKPEHIVELYDYLQSYNVDSEIIDLRHNKGRYDDVMIVCRKLSND
jgi:hypothetical protein